WIKSGDVSVRRIVVQQARKIVPVGIENHLPCRHVGAHPESALRVMIARIAFVNVFGGAIDVREQSEAQRQRDQTGFEQLPVLFALAFFLGGSRLLSIEKRLQIFEHIVRQTREDRAPTPKTFQRKSREQNRERRKVLGETLPARDHQQQRRRQDQKEERPLGPLAIAE